MRARGRCRCLLVAVAVVLAMPALAACSDDEPAGGDVVAITILQMNDVYELTPVSGGDEGGLARVATLRSNLLAENPNTYTVLAGDLLNPSALSTATVDGERLAGRQMVDVMNVLGLDYATFGNHEFDLTQERLAQRLAESKFTWFSSNVTQSDGQPFPNVPANVVLTARNHDGREVRVGLFGLTVGSNPAPYVAYRDPVVVAKEQVAALRDRVDILIAVTHLALDGDIDLVEEVPEIDLVLGGHEHENTEVERGPDFTPVSKADANARSVYVHRLRWDPSTRQLEHEASLERVTPALADDPTVAKAVDRWVNAAFEGFRAQGFEPTRTVATTTEPLDGRESSVRNHPTRLTDLIASGMRHAASGTELAVFNSGSIRIDDVIPPGEVTEYDVIRTLPFGDTIQAVQMKGTLLQRTLDQGLANAGTGGYLQLANVARAPAGDGWLVDGAPLDAGRSYSVAVNDFLLTGREIKLDFLTRANPELTVVSEHGDLRKVLIAELQR
jgi:5'-nucleotidase / UDP-sugar diphosphatase